MFCLSIHVGQVVWQMLYKTEDAARANCDLLTAARSTAFSVPSPACVVSDDFGQTAHAIISSLHGWMLEDLDLSKLAHVEKGLHNARTQNDYVKRVQADPSARPQMQGPPMLAPSGNGLFRQ